MVAVSWGKGDPQRDAISIVYLDPAGRMRESTKIDNLVDQEMRDDFLDMLRRRKPDVIVIGGFTMATAKLSQRVKEVTTTRQLTEEGGWGEPMNPEAALDIPITYVPDEVARIYQHSSRAAEEFPGLSQTAKYCVGLARYAQSPLNEFAALGPDVMVISLKEEDQHLVMFTHLGNECIPKLMFSS